MKFLKPFCTQANDFDNFVRSLLNFSSSFISWLSESNSSSRKISVYIRKLSMTKLSRYQARKFFMSFSWKIEHEKRSEIEIGAKVSSFHHPLLNLFLMDNSFFWIEDVDINSDTINISILPKIYFSFCRQLLSNYWSSSYVFWTFIDTLTTIPKIRPTISSKLV